MWVQDFFFCLSSSSRLQKRNPNSLSPWLLRKGVAIMGTVKPSSILSKRLLLLLIFWKPKNLWPCLCFVLWSLLVDMNIWCLALFTWIVTSLWEMVGHILLWQQVPGRHCPQLWPDFWTADCNASQHAQITCWEMLHSLISFGDAENVTRVPQTTSFIHCQGHDSTVLWLCLIHSLSNASENKPRTTYHHYYPSLLLLGESYNDYWIWHWMTVVEYFL